MNYELTLTAKPLKYDLHYKNVMLGNIKSTTGSKTCCIIRSWKGRKAPEKATKGNDLMKKLTFNTLQKLTGLSKTLCVIFSIAELYDIFRVKSIEHPRSDLLLLIWTASLLIDYVLCRYMNSRYPKHNF